VILECRITDWITLGCRYRPDAGFADLLKALPDCQIFK